MTLTADCENNTVTTRTSSCTTNSTVTSTGSTDGASPLPIEWFQQCSDAAASHRGRLYGRDKEVTQMYEIYDNIRTATTTSKSSHVILISGVTGIGKTGLARSIEDHVSATADMSMDGTNSTKKQTSGYFALGKYDQLQRPEPHCALVEVCTQLIAHVVDRDQTDLLCQTLACHGIDYNHGGQDLIEMIPSLQTILKPPSPPTTTQVVTSMMKKEEYRTTSDNGSTGIPLITTTGNISLSTNRWKDMFRLFLRAVSSLQQNNEPVVVLIEDLHWADESSMDVLQTLFQDKSNHNTLFICTFRTKDCCTCETSSSMPSQISTLQRLVKSLTQHDVALTHIALDAVRIDVITNMVANILSANPIDVESLAVILQKSTKGNFLLLWKCMYMLKFKNLLTTDPDDGRFIWDIEEIDIEMQAVKDILKYKIGLLPESSQESLKIAACLGSKLDKDILLRLLSANEAAVSAFIDDAARVKLLCFDKSRGAWCFPHDYVQEKVYEFIPCNERIVYHYRIGRKLWREFALEELTEFICLVVGQLLLGRDCIKCYKESVAVAKLCLGAGVRAFQLSNFQSSYKYLKSGISLLSERSWDDEYDLMINLHKTAAEVANSLGVLADVDALVTESLAHSKSYEDTHRARATQLQTLGRCGKLEEAIQFGVNILVDLNEKIPTKQSPYRTLFEISLLRRRVRGRTNEMIMRIPIMTDPKKLAAMEIMNLIFLYTAIVRPELTPLLGCRMVRMSLDHGLSALSCVGFAIFAATVSGVGQAFEEGNRLGLLGFSLLQKFNAKPWLARMSDIYFDLVFGWVRPFVDCRVPLMDAYNTGLQAGDTEFALSCALTPLFIDFEIRPLPEIMREMEILRERIELYGLKNLEIILRPIFGLTKALSGNYSGDVNEVAKIIVDDNSFYFVEANHFLIKWMHVHRAFKFYLFGVYDEAETNARAAASLAVAFFGPFRGALVAIICGLADVAHARKMKRKQAFLAKKCSKLLLRWATDGEPRNFLGKHFLLEAEIAAMAGKKSLSYRHYVSAIGACKEGKVLLFTAIALERAAKSLLEWGQNDLAGPYFREAIASYEVWGATIKVQHLRLEMLQFGF